MRCRTLGLVGGMSWESSALYYRLINEAVADRLGGHHNARSVLVTLNFEDVLSAGLREDWAEVARLVIQAAQSAELAGADCVLLTANTAHLVADQVEASCRVPLVHIVDAVGADARRRSLGRLGLIGTRQTIASGLYARRLAERHDIDVAVPSDTEQADLQKIILEELTRGVTRDASRDRCREIIDGLAALGCGGVVIGCTELPMLLNGDEMALPTLDSTRLHVEAAVTFAFDDNVTTTEGSHAI